MTEPEEHTQARGHVIMQRRLMRERHKRELNALYRGLTGGLFAMLYRHKQELEPLNRAFEELS